MKVDSLDKFLCLFTIFLCSEDNNIITHPYKTDTLKPYTLFVHLYSRAVIINAAYKDFTVVCYFLFRSGKGGYMAQSMTAVTLTYLT